MTRECFADHVMFCSSTDNQTVNLIPAVQFGIKEVVILSTGYTDKSRLTERLTKEMSRQGITVSRVEIGPEEEKSLNWLVERLDREARTHRRIIWNISGGQKIPTLALYEAFRKRIGEGHGEDAVLYMEARPPEIWYWGAGLETSSVPARVNLTLDAIVRLYGSEAARHMKLHPNPSEEVLRKLETGRRALDYFVSFDQFRESFFRYMMPDEGYARTKKELEELIKRCLNEIGPELSAMQITNRDYRGLEHAIKDFCQRVDEVQDRDELARLMRDVKMIANPKAIYDDYWNSIKKEIVRRISKGLESKDPKLVQGRMAPSELARLKSAIETIGGEVADPGPDTIYKSQVRRFSAIPPNGVLFEWMAAAAVIDAVTQDRRMMERVAEVHFDVETRKLDDPSAKPDTQLDLVVVTTFGTLLVLEMKTHEFSGDTIKGKENAAYKKSGPYGKAIVVGPLIDGVVSGKQPGTKTYPPYIDNKVRDQEETAKQNDIEYVRVDRIALKLHELLQVKE